jgi:hypothetical protein
MTLRAPPAERDYSPDRERRRQTDRRRGARERRRLLLQDATLDDRRRETDERRSGLDRRVEWADARPPRFPLEQHLVRDVRTSRIGSLIDLLV